MYVIGLQNEQGHGGLLLQDDGGLGRGNEFDNVPPGEGWVVGAGDHHIHSDPHCKILSLILIWLSKLLRFL